jgi:aldehyde dehydrogenase (NAD+)
VTADPVAALKRLRATFAAGVTRPLSWRRAQLRGMRGMLVDRETELLEAMREDLGRPAAEGWLTDLLGVTREIDHALANLDDWARPRRVRVPLALRPGRATIAPEPLGVALVIAPWNYPVHLLLVPMASAIAAGNSVMGKPSEVAAHTSATLARLVPEYLDPAAVAVVEADAGETAELLRHRFDHVFFTGSARVGRLVMEAAARHLTPVTLELGGKCPAIVDAGTDLAVTARRIAFGKFLGAGQTCLAPDHVLVHREAEGALVDALARAIRDLYGDDPRRSRDYGRVVSRAHVDRLRRLLEAGGYERVAAGGEIDEADRYVAPTVLAGVSPEAPLMQEEIFGPILPVLPVADLDAASAFVRARPIPLAVYVFAEPAAARRVLAATRSGGAAIGTTILHAGIPDLPYGGLGESGTGAYHGRHGFETFSHRRSVFVKPARPDPRSAYPPFRWLRLRGVRRLLRRLL